jgi:hypothetical protein
MTGDLYCQNCGDTGRPVTRVKGSFLTEALIWIAGLFFGLIVSWWFLLPAVLYSVWRLSTKDRVCPTCAAPRMIPLDSPKAKAARAGTTAPSDVAPPATGGKFGFTRDH